MKRFLWLLPAVSVWFGAGLGCGGGDKAVIPTGPVAAPEGKPLNVPMMGPKIPQNKGN